MRILKVAPDLYGFLRYTEGIWAPESVYSVAGGMASGAQQPRLLQQTLACTKLSFFETLQATAEMKNAQILGRASTTLRNFSTLWLGPAPRTQILRQRSGQ